ncbi:zinc-dependent metalloprotease [Bdellovibrio sp. NC01]|uniref:zinc-dependent metalloprotease n=1 Tax=Bdellovibrio sp. NC01 TaxID=2220073 RepID=UPI00143D88D1|nr:zinc-dependent metalloprotease [Bdellovibrio sp. NC01]
MAHKPQYTKAFTALLAFALVASGCTKKRDAALSDQEALQTFAISDFGTVSENSGFKANMKASVRSQALVGSQNSKATEEKGLVAVDADDSSIPSRLRFMFNDLEVSGTEKDNFKIVFGIDSKFVTAYKLASIDSLSKFEKQLAVSPSEVQLSIELQKASGQAAKKQIAEKMAQAQKARSLSLTNRAAVNVLVPLFKYDILAKGVLERTKNELRESTSTLTMRETEFSQATHIRLNTSSDSRKDIGSAEQKKELDQLFTAESLDNKVSTAAELQARYNFNMKFVADDSKVMTKLDAEDMKVYELTTLSALSDDERRLLKTGSANGEILTCDASVSQDKNCVLRLVAKVPVTYKNILLNLADNKDNTTNSLELRKVTKAQSQGLVEIARDQRAERARPTGIIDPLNTLKISDLQGEFYYRRTFEDASNMMVVGKTGTSGDLAVVKFEFERDRVVVRNQKALIQFVGQGPKDKEELMSMPVKYFKLEKVDADGVALQVPKLIDAKKEDAEYVELDWTKNTVPVANSPLAFFEAGQCWQAESSSQVTDPDNRLSADGILNFSIAGSYTVRPECANQAKTNGAYFSLNAQFNYNVVERLSFKKRTHADIDDMQFAPNISPDAQNAMNFAIFTLADAVNKPDVRAGRENSEVYHPVIHDFRNGKVLNYWVGGLADAPADRRALIEEAAAEVVAEWNEAFHKAFKGTELDRAGDFIVLNKEDDATRGHLGDLDRNYLWFMDKEAENGLLGVAQPAPNPYSGTIMANNVIVYSGNSEREVRGMMASYKDSREYEKMLEEAKTEALADLQKQIAAQKAGEAGQGSAATGNAATDKAAEMTRHYGSFISKLALSARPAVNTRMTSKYAGAVEAKKAGNPKAKGRQVKARTLVSDTKVAANKDFAKRVLEQALSGEFKNDPLMLEAIVSREMARQDGLSENIKALLEKKAEMTAMSAKFDKASKLRGGCFMYSRAYYNDRFVETDFNTLFKKEIKATLLHEVGHALGLVHNFKASFDRDNFAFEGENTKRNYTSIMDYIAAPEMEYAGPGTYDVHALRAIYTGRVELSKAAQDMAAKSNGVLQISKDGAQAKVMNGKFIGLSDVKTLLGFPYWSNMQKQLVNQSGLLRHYGQCHDGLVGIEPACTPYDSGVSATDIVKNTIQDYNRLYINGYHAADRLNFGWSQKVSMVSRAIGEFQTIRGFLDDYFRMVIYENALNQAEQNDFAEAARLGYDFFHEVIRIPNTNLPFGNSKEEIKQRLIAYPYTAQIPVMKKNADGTESQAVDSKGNPVFEQKADVKVLEARRVYDYAPAPSEDRFDTLGIGFDKQFAVRFLLNANPRAMTDDSQTGWISYNEFEQYFLGVDNAAQSLNMMTLLEIMSGSLTSGFFDAGHNFVQVAEAPVTINRNLLDAATLGSLADTNQYRATGLDTFAEFFKVGTLKGGKGLNDRFTATRYGQSSTSSTAVKFFAADNASGANVLISMAARKAALVDNKQVIGQGLIGLLNMDMQIQAKAGELVAKDEKLKGKSLPEIIASNEDLKALSAKADAAQAELVKALTAINVNGLLVSDAEVKQNPNLSLDGQVKMARVMMAQSLSYLTQAKKYLEQVPLDQLQGLLQQLGELKAQNDQLAQLDLIALSQEVLMQATSNMQINLKDRGPVPASAVLSIMMTRGALTSSHQNLMYSIEDLARYTSILNPEYVY